MKILVLGSQGQLGHCLVDHLSLTDHEAFFHSRIDTDVCDDLSLERSLAAINPDVVINASAYTAVDKAEGDEVSAFKLNHLAVKKIAEFAKAYGFWFFHISTDYVFDGQATAPYSERDATNPQSVYGRSKLEGEIAILNSGCNYLIIRTAWVFSEYGNNFLNTMLRLGKEADEINVVGDQVGCPTYAQDIASTICNLLTLIEPSMLEKGIYHYCGDSPCSWYDFARVIFNESQRLGLRVPHQIRPIKAIDYVTPATRPAFSVLDCHKIRQLPNIILSDWRVGVMRALETMKNNVKLPR